MPNRPRPLTPILLTKALKKSLSEADRIAVLGIGSDLRADDAAGVLVARRLKRSWSRSGSRRAAFEGGTAPENLTGEIIGFIRGDGKGARGHVVFVDTADMDLKAGSVCLLSYADLAGVSFSTHQLPLSVLADYLQHSLPVEVSFIAIQPKTISFGKSLSSAGSRAVDLVVSALRDAVPTPRPVKRGRGSPGNRTRAPDPGGGIGPARTRARSGRR